MRARLDRCGQPFSVEGESDGLHALACSMARRARRGDLLPDRIGYPRGGKRLASGLLVKEVDRPPPVCRGTTGAHRRTRPAGSRSRREPPGRPSVWIEQHGADRVGKLAGLSAHFIKSPLRLVRQPRHRNGFDELAAQQGGLEDPSMNSSIGTERRPDAPRTTTLAPSAARHEIQSADGSAWATPPPMVPRLRTAR